MTDQQKTEATEKGNGGQKPEAAGEQRTKIRWDTARMTSSYANVCNVTSTREEVTLLFGTNQAWNPTQGELTVELSNRVILNPHAAKRFASALNTVMKEYESRFGAIKTEV